MMTDRELNRFGVVGLIVAKTEKQAKEFAAQLKELGAEGPFMCKGERSNFTGVRWETIIYHGDIDPEIRCEIEHALKRDGKTYYF